MSETIFIYRESTVDHLRNRLNSGDSVHYYVSGSDFPDPEDGDIMKSSIEVVGKVPSLKQPDKRPPKTDKNAAIQVYRHLGEMSRLQASDERLWTYLCHQVFWDYMTWRWDIDSNAESPETKIKDRYFASGANLEAVGRNGIARLWWGAYLTRDPWKRIDGHSELEKKDKFYYTKVLFRAQQIHQSVMERGYGSSLKVRICMLDTIDRYTKTGAIGKFVKNFAKRVNLICTHRELQTLPARQLLAEMDEIAPGTADIPLQKVI